MTRGYLRPPLPRSTGYAEGEVEEYYARLRAMPEIADPWASAPDGPSASSHASVSTQPHPASPDPHAWRPWPGAAEVRGELESAASRGSRAGGSGREDDGAGGAR